MSGWDADRISVSNQGLIPAGSVGYEESNERVVDTINQIIDFLSKFKEAGTGDTEFYYKDQIRRNLRSKRLTVNLGHLINSKPDISSRLNSKPSTIIPYFESAAATVAKGFDLREELEPEEIDNELLNTSTTTWQVDFKTGAEANSIRYLSSDDVSHLVLTSGIVISSSPVRAKCSKLRIVCSNCKDARKIDAPNGFGLIQLPRQCLNARNEAQAAGDIQKCPPDSYVIDSDRSDFVDMQTLKLQELPEATPTGEMPRTLLCYLTRRTMINALPPGTRVKLLGIYNTFERKAKVSGNKSTAALRTPYLNIIGMMELDEMESISGGRTSFRFSPKDEEEIREFASETVLEDLRNSVAPAIKGHDEIKSAIVSLLFGGSSKTLPDGMRLRGDINVLLLGDPGTAKSQFLKFVEKVAPIGVYTSGKGSSAAGLTASVHRDNNSGEFYLEGGAMVLADGGVCCIDEFDKMREQDRVAIHEAMEQGTISIAKAGITTMLNSRTAVLAAANPVFGRYDDLRSAAENIDFQTTILSRFDLIFIVRDIPDVHKDQELAKHIIGVHRRAGMDVGGVGSADAPASVDFKKLKKYIAYARSRIHPILNDDASKRLVDAYVEFRTNLNGGTDRSDQTIPITVRQLEALIRISESIAKQSLAETVTIDHVEKALQLFRVATVDAANSGIVTETVTEELRDQIERIEEYILRRIPIGSTVRVSTLVNDIKRAGFHNNQAFVRAINGLERRGIVRYANQRRSIQRVGE